MKPIYAPVKKTGSEKTGNEIAFCQKFRCTRAPGRRKERGREADTEQSRATRVREQKKRRNESIRMESRVTGAAAAEAACE